MVRRNTHRKEQIIKIATQLFANKGYHAVTLDEIAKRLKIQKASLYYYIKSKRALFEEISDTLVTETVANIDEIYKSNLNPIDKLRKFISNQIIANTNSTDLTTIFYDEASSIDKRFYSRYKQFKKKGEMDLQLILTEGVERGYFNIDDIKMTAFLILSACNWVYKWYKPNGRLKPQEIASEYIKILECGIIAPQYRKNKAE
jgi:AcrR family transcriptional regulator